MTVLPAFFIRLFSCRSAGHLSAGVIVLLSSICIVLFGGAGRATAQNAENRKPVETGRAAEGRSGGNKPTTDAARAESSSVKKDKDTKPKDASTTNSSDNKSRPTVAPAKPLGEWSSGPVTTDSGAFAYCVASNRFDNDLVLVIGRTAANDINLAIGIPKGGLELGLKWPVTVMVDDALKRPREAAAIDPELVIVSLGKDEEFFNALIGGRRIDIQGPMDTAAFQLRGSNAAIPELRKCVEKGRASGKVAKVPTVPSGRTANVDTQNAAAAVATTPPATESVSPLVGSGSRGESGGKRPAIPQALGAVLAMAGLKDITPLSLAGIPPEQRPADFAWRVGSLFGGVRETQVSDNRDLAALTTAYMQALKRRCAGPFVSELGTVETVGTIALRPGFANCGSVREGKNEIVHVSMAFYLTHTRLFTVFFHESPEAERATADQIRDRLIAVIRELAEQAPPEKPNRAG